MVALITEIGKKMVISVLLVMVLGCVCPALLAIGETAFQTVVVFSFYSYCAISLFSYSRHKLFHVLSIPVFTQFLHLFQKYTFTAGANSIWRLLPFIILNLYFSHYFLTKYLPPTNNEKLLLASWGTIQAFFLIISPNLDRVVWGGSLLFLVTLPMYFLYLKTAMAAVDFRSEMESYLCLLYIILGLGTFGLVIAGSGYKDSDNLLATRNISDTNVTMAYFILLWPFALLFSERKRFSTLLLLIIFGIFIGIVVFSFSRGAVLIVAPYLLISLILLRNLSQGKWMMITIAVLALYTPELFSFLENDDLTYFWQLRFGNIISLSSALARLQEISGRAEIHAIAYQLFLEKPLVGHGTGSFEILGPGYREAHSLLYTLLAEQGVIGVLYMYLLFGSLGMSMFSVFARGRKYLILPVSFAFYLLFNHTVGSVFVIIPGKSVTINCIAPVLLLCLYFYVKSFGVLSPSVARKNA
ncbi:MAG: O-antigen polymerase [Dyadobacter sp.]|uniref:O-antigen ligase family protein n=1 Tax=Dyadobacter sp. TaxID=1914288 RepID=UPI0032679100